MAAIEVNRLSLVKSIDNIDYYKTIIGLNILKKGIHKYVMKQIRDLFSHMLKELDSCCIDKLENDELCDECIDRIKKFLTQHHKYSKIDFTKTKMKKCVIDEWELVKFICDPVYIILNNELKDIGCNAMLSFMMNVKSIESNLLFDETSDIEIFSKVTINILTCPD